MLNVQPLAAHEAEFTLHIDGELDGTFHVIRFSAAEAMSELFELRVELSSSSGHHQLATLVGKVARLTATHALGARHFHGLLRHIRVAERGRLHTRYHAVIVPRMWLLGQRQDARIFQELSTPDILAQVFEGVGLSGPAVELCLSREYAPRNYCVQYHETDLAFASRLMEEEGIYYFFEHSEEGHVLILGDDPVVHGALAPARFRPPQMADSPDQHILRVEYGRSVRPGRATLVDYTFKAPTTDLERSAEFPGLGDDGEDPNTDLEIYAYPGDYVEADLGEELARLRMEQLQVDRVQLTGDSDLRRLCPGFRVELMDHPLSQLNREWLLTRVVHEGAQQAIDGQSAQGEAGSYQNRLEAIPADLPFRPPLATPKPRIFGLQTAIVTGPSGEEIHVDEHGRVKVHFHWDRVNPLDDTSSCWVRVSQAWAGTGFGHVYLPRIGQEVIVQFLEGDPDRPLVTGRVYNGDNALPYPLPDERTKSTIKSNTSPGGGGSNELRFEDMAGSEEIFLHGQKDWTIGIENDKSQSVGHDSSTSVGNNNSLSVGGDDSTTVTGKQTLTVTKSREVKVDDKQGVTVKNDFSSTVTDGNCSLVVTKGDYSIQTAAKSMIVDAKLNFAVDAKELIYGTTKSFVIAASESAMITTEDAIIAGKTSVAVLGKEITLAGSKITISASTEIMLMVGGSSIKIDIAGVTLIGPKIQLN